MGILSKLFGAKLEKEARDLINGLANGGSGNAAKPEQAKPASAQPQSSYQTRPAAPSGLSWGEEMPSEENQFSFKGSYVQYFEGIFRTEFAEYQIKCDVAQRQRSAVFTFEKGDRKALVVELLSQSSDAKKLRRDCKASGIPYLRYYYDHDGWWNTRSYVIGRTKNALNG